MFPLFSKLTLSLYFTVVIIKESFCNIHVGTKYKIKSSHSNFTTIYYCEWWHSKCYTMAVVNNEDFELAISTSQADLIKDNNECKFADIKTVVQDKKGSKAKETINAALVCPI